MKLLMESLHTDSGSYLHEGAENFHIYFDIVE